MSNRRDCVAGLLLLAVALASPGDASGQIGGPSLQMLEQQEKMIMANPGIPEADRQRMLGELKAYKERLSKMPPEEANPQPVQNDEEPPQFERPPQTTRDWPVASDPVAPAPLLYYPRLPSPSMQSFRGRMPDWAMMPFEQLLKNVRNTESWAVLNERVSPLDRPLFPSKVIPLTTLALYRLGDPKAKQMLLSELSSPEGTLRLDAIETLGLSRDATVRTTLEALLADPDLFVRRRAALALGRIGARESLPALEKAVKDGDQRVRRMALLAISLLDQPSAPPVPAATGPVPRYSAWRARETTGPLTEPVAAAVRKGLADAETSVRLYAAELLAMHGDPSGRKVLEAGPANQMVYLALAALGDAAALEQLDRYQQPSMQAFRLAWRVQPAAARSALVTDARDGFLHPGTHQDMAGTTSWPLGRLCLGRDPQDAPLLKKQLDSILCPFKLGLAGGSCDPSYFEKGEVPSELRATIEAVAATRPATASLNLCSTWLWHLSPGGLLNRLGIQLEFMAEHDAKLAAELATGLLSEERAPLALVAGLALADMNTSADPAPLERWLKSRTNSIRLMAAVELALMGSRAGTAVLADWARIHHWPVPREANDTMAKLELAGAFRLLRDRIALNFDDPLEPEDIDQNRVRTRWWQLLYATKAATALGRLNPEVGLAWARQGFRPSVPSRSGLAISLLAGDALGAAGDEARRALLGSGDSWTLKKFCWYLSIPQTRALSASLLSLAESAKNPADAETAMGRLTSINHPRAVEKLKAEYAGANRERRVYLAGVLAPFKHPGALELLKEEAEEGEGKARLDAALALAEAGDASGASLLERLVPPILDAQTDQAVYALHALTNAFLGQGYVPSAKILAAVRSCLDKGSASPSQPATALLCRLPGGLTAQEMAARLKGNADSYPTELAYLVELACCGTPGYQDPFQE